MSYLDSHPNVIGWASEEIVIPYRSPIDGRVHRYFPDFVVKMKSKDGKVVTQVIEIKPERETKPPKVRQRATKQYIYEVKTWGVNQAKWAAAESYCKDRDWEFRVFTESELGLKRK
jgi:hypothetical protein